MVITTVMIDNFTVYTKQGPTLENDNALKKMITLIALFCKIITLFWKNRDAILENHL